MNTTRNSALMVCIVCALAEEARAFLRVVEDFCHILWDHKVNDRHGYDYYLATITNIKGDFVCLYVSWLSRYGPQEMVLHLSHVVEEYQPQLTVMTGICAGDKRHVRLGDLVVAERAFTYDSGKVVKDEQGQSVYLHDTTTYQVHENIKRFADFFEQWKPHVATLARPSSKRQQRDWLLERLLAEPTGSLQSIPLTELELHAPSWRQLKDELQQGPIPFLSSLYVLCDKEIIRRLRYGRVPFPFQDPPEAHCRVCALASGSAVRSDNPFEAIQVPVRGAVAIDMEGAAFGRVMERCPGGEWLIVKGVSDYADHEKDDSYHLYAEMASAVYALCFIEAYVTQERFPSSRNDQQPLSGEGMLSLEKGSKALWDGGYSFAKKELRQAIEKLDEEQQDREASQARYFLALALLGGKLPRIQGREIMRFVEELMNEAIRIHPYASYYRIFARIEKDFFEYNGYRHRLNEVDLLERKGESFPRCKEDEEMEEYFRHSQPRLHI